MEMAEGTCHWLPLDEACLGIKFPNNPLFGSLLPDAACEGATENVPPASAAVGGAAAAFGGAVAGVSSRPNQDSGIGAAPPLWVAGIAL